MRLWYRISQALTGNCFTRAHKWCPWIEQAYKDALLSTCSTTKTRENQRVTFSNQHSESERATCSKTYLRFKARSHSLMHVSVTTGRAEKFDGLALAKWVACEWVVLTGYDFQTWNGIILAYGCQERILRFVFVSLTPHEW